MNILSRTEFRRSALLLALILLSACLLIPGAFAVTISTGTYQIDTVGNTTTIPIVMDQAPTALSGYNLTIDLSPAGVANSTDFTFASWATFKSKSGLPGNHVIIRAVDGESVVTSADRNIVLGTLTVKGISVGSAAIRITANAVDDGQGNRYSVTTPAGQLTVGTPVTTVPTTVPTTAPTTTVPTTVPTTTVPTTTVTPGALTADFQVATTPGSNLVKITDKSANAATVRYDLGDGASTRNMAVPVPVISYYYVTANTYTITQTAISAGGQTATKQVSVTVGGAPTITTTVPTTTTIPTTITTTVPTTTTIPTTTTVVPTVTVTPGYPVPDFTLTTPTSMGIQIMDASVNATSVRYDLGDGTTTTYRNFRYIYWQPGTYTIKLTATNAMGSSTKTVQVTVPATPATTATTPAVTPTVTTTATPGGQPYKQHSVPGLIEAEDYDLGGSGVGYMDTTAGNAGKAYRQDDVDIEAGASGYDVGWVINGEKLVYSVDAAAAGDYPVSLRASNPDAQTKQVQLTTLGDAAATVNVLSTGSFDTYGTFSSEGAIRLEQGRNIVTVTFGASRMNLDSITLGAGVQPTPTVTATTTTAQPTTTVTTAATTAQPTPTVTTTVQPTGTPLSTPYYMISMVPGHVESYSYDNGGEGVAYHDTTMANLGGKLRSDAVDIEYSQADAGYNLGYVIGGEWLIYSVQIDTAGIYTVAIRASNPDSTDKHIALSLEGSSTPLATVTVPSTGSFDKYQTFTTTVQMPAGRHWLKLSFPENRVNVRFMDFTRGASTGIPDQGVTTTQVPVTDVVTTPAAAQNNTTVRA